jgi:hypothetical protein
LAFTQRAAIILQLPSAVYFILFLVGFVIDKLALGQSSLRVLWFSLSISFYHCSIFTCVILEMDSVSIRGKVPHRNSLTLLYQKNLWDRTKRQYRVCHSTHAHTHTHTNVVQRKLSCYSIFLKLHYTIIFIMHMQGFMYLN